MNSEFDRYQGSYRDAVNASIAFAGADVDFLARLKADDLVDTLRRNLGSSAHSTGARVLVARIFNIIGRRETNPHVVPELIGQLRDGGRRVRLGNLAPRRDYTDARDAADALERLLALSPRQQTIVNVGSGRSVSVADLIAACERIVGQPIEVEVESGRRRATDRAELVADSALLQSLTGWAPERTLDETLIDLFAEP